MGHIIHEEPSRPVGRPKEGAQPKSIERKVRLEPYADEQLGVVCRYFGIPKSEAIRRGIMMFLKEAEKIIY